MNNITGSFVVADSEKCTGCKACEVACFASHNKKNGVGHTVGTVTTPVVARLYLTRAGERCMPIQCKHCENAPCLNSCSAGAISRIDGTVVINEEKCIGCKNCMMACPFGAIELAPLARGGKVLMQTGADEVRKSAYKCDLCIHQGDPACVAACPNQALQLVAPEEELKEKRIKAALGLDLLK